MNTRKVLLILILAAALTVLSASSSLDARASARAPGVLAGGDYLLTIRAAGESQPPAYQWLNSSETKDTSGCCCDSFLPCIIR